MPTYGGIDLGGTKIQAVIVDEDHNVLGSARRPTPTSGGPKDVAAEMETALRDAAGAAELQPASLAGVGVGSPGTIADGSVTSARNLPGWQGTFPLAATLERALGCGVAVGNDVQVATDAEFRLGAGRLYSSLLGVFWGTGVGGGLILDGKPWTGRGGRARSGTSWWRSTGPAARADGAAAWRRTRGGRRWRLTCAPSARRRDARPTCSS